MAGLFGIFGKSSNQSNTDLFESYLVTAEAQWASVAPQSKIDNPELTEQVEKLIVDCRTLDRDIDRQWKKVSLLEQLVAVFLTASQLRSEGDRRLVKATSQGIPSAEALKDRWADLVEANQVEDMRSLYITLLDEMQWHYCKRRMDRRARFRAVIPILIFGITLFIIAFIPLFSAIIAGVTGDMWSVHPRLGLGSHMYGLYIAVSFGLLGAMFSRLSSLQSNFMNLDYDLVRNLFRSRVIGVRLIFGMIGSVIIYFAIFGHLLAGDIFPDTANLKQEFRGGPTVDEAKLVVWSFLGGFSERLVPDFLQRTETSATANTPDQ